MVRGHCIGQLTACTVSAAKIARAAEISDSGSGWMDQVASNNITHYAGFINNLQFLHLPSSCLYSYTQHRGHPLANFDDTTCVLTPAAGSRG